MGYAINQDMTEIYNNPDKWINHGRNVLENSCKHHDQNKEETNIRYSGYCDKCDVSEDAGISMMNYLYPLELTDFEEKKILKVMKETNCTILENSETGEYFLALCGGGMNLSQDIAFSYVILEKWIPQDLLNSVATQPLLSLGSKKYKILAREIISQLKTNANRMKEKRKIWKEELKQLNLREKAKKD
jgi:hypothetical protein